MSRDASSSQLEEVRSLLERLSFVRLVFVDLFGSARSLQVPASRLLQGEHPGVYFDGSAIEGRTRLLEEDMLLIPDFSTLMDMGNGIGRAFCRVDTPDGLAWPVDPRTSLLDFCDNPGGPVAGLVKRWTASAELEFYVLRPDLKPVDRGGYFADIEGAGIRVARTVAKRMHALGIRVSGIHHEAGPGQYEIDLPALDPVALADAIILAKQMIAEEARAADLTVTFAARPLDGEPGSGLHLHQHIEGATMVPSLSPDAEAMIAGILYHARGLVALAAPSPNSYRRLHAGPEAPGMAIWAHENRSALVRVGASTDGKPSIEFRASDPTCNPYLLVIGLLAAEQAGLAEGFRVGQPVEEEPMGFDPAALEVAPRLLPRNLDEALDALLDDEVLCDAFDDRLLSRLVEGSRTEMEAANAKVGSTELLSYLE
ncbi:MAG: glutamine synthetase family protein [Acidimicrobiales bacterium]